MDPEPARYQHLIRAVLARPWAIDPESYAWAAMMDVLALRAAGGVLTEAEIQARIDAAANGPRAGGGRSGSIAVVPLYGLISPRANLMSAMSGGTTAEGFTRSFRAAMADPDITAVLLDVDSPGGNVAGITEAATAVREARGQKPIVAIANHDAASAAYWIAAQADELVVTPSGQVGSIGVVGAHQDISEAQAKLGVKTTLISAGKFKTEGNPFEPLSDEARAERQAGADAIYGQFLADVAKGRRVTAAKVRSDYGQGRMLLAKDAVAAGMADRVDTFEGTVRRLGAGRVKSAPANVPAEPTGDTEATTDVAPAAAEPATTPPPITPAAVAGRRAQRELRQAALERGYAIG